MPVALLLIGIAFIVVGYQGTQGDLIDQLEQDFTGSNNFIVWIFVLIFIGSIGYIPKLRPVANGFIILVILVLVLAAGSKKGLFAKLQEAIKGSGGQSADPLTTNVPGVPGVPALPNIGGSQ